MLRLLHISDLHFGPKHAPEVSKALLRQADQFPVDLVVASGDFTQRAKRREYQAAREFLDALPPRPLLMIPGNHDVPLYRVWERISAPHRNYEEFISSNRNPVWRHDDAVIVSLDSTAPLRTITNGIIDPWQIDYCRDAFAEASPDQARVVVTHHPFILPQDHDKAHRIRRARSTMASFVELEVDLVLGGHLHRSYCGDSFDVISEVFDLHRVLIVQSGTTTSKRGRGREKGRNSLNVITIEGNQITVVHWYFVGDHFVPRDEHRFPRQRRAEAEHSKN